MFVILGVPTSDREIPSLSTRGNNTDDCMQVNQFNNLKHILRYMELSSLL